MTPLDGRWGDGGAARRAIGDRFVTLYRFAGGTPVPVASKRTMKRRRRVATFVPNPYRSAH